MKNMKKEKKEKQHLKFEFDISKAEYKLDILQQRMLEFYLRNDPRFRMAYSMNYTPDFIQFLKDKVELNEVVHLGGIGQVRSGKSYGMITVCILHQAYYGQRFTVDYICANAYEFLEKLKSFSQDRLTNRIFLIDEEKQSVFNIGSMAKKMKLEDVQNIIAINNISTIMINPVSWANKNAMYGLRAWGRCFKTKTTRFMIYNLQEKGKGGELPMGNVYLPIFTEILPKDEADILEKAYLKKKKEWVIQEQRGEGDVLAEIRKKSAETFLHDKKFLSLEKKAEKLTYISQKMGSEWTSKEIEDIYQIINLLTKKVL